MHVPLCPALLVVWLSTLSVINLQLCIGADSESNPASGLICCWSRPLLGTIIFTWSFSKACSNTNVLLCWAPAVKVFCLFTCITYHIMCGLCMVEGLVFLLVPRSPFANSRHFACLRKECSSSMETRGHSIPRHLADDLSVTIPLAVNAILDWTLLYIVKATIIQ